VPLPAYACSSSYVRDLLPPKSVTCYRADRCYGSRLMTSRVVATEPAGWVVNPPAVGWRSPEFGMGTGPMEYLVGYLGTPFAWSIFVVLATAVAAAMIVYGIHALRRTDEPDPLFGGVSGMLKQDWARTKQIDFHLPDSTSPAAHPPCRGKKDRRKFDGAGGGPAALAPRDRGGSQGGCRLLERPRPRRQGDVTGPPDGRPGARSPFRSKMGLTYGFT